MQFEIDISSERPTQPEVAKAPPRSFRLPLHALGLSLLVCAFAAGALWFEPYPLDALRDEWRLFAALAALLGVAWSWFFALLGGRVRTLGGSPVTPLRAFVRAVLAVPSAALAGFGFVLAFFDRRGQTLHDKLTGCVLDRPRG